MEQDQTVRGQEQDEAQETAVKAVDPVNNGKTDHTKTSQMPDGRACGTQRVFKNLQKK